MLFTEISKFTGVFKTNFKEKKIDYSLIKKKVVLFQCTSSYPCKDEEANLNV